MKPRFLEPGWIFLYCLVTIILGYSWYRSQFCPWSIVGEVARDRLGSKVGTAGDVNGDGFDDVAVWAAGHNDHAGKLYVFHGSNRGLAQKPAWTGEGEGVQHQFGASFAACGDVNDDGYEDIVVGAQSYSGPDAATNTGKAYLYLGSASGLQAEPAWTQTGYHTSELFGDNVSGAGDINQDGLADVSIGAYGFDKFKGRAYLFFGNRETGLDPTPVWTGEGDEQADWYGYSTASAGDVNGDGFGDLVVSAKQAARDDLINVGRVYVYHGSKKGLSENSKWKVAGEKQQDLFGWWVTSAGCLNNRQAIEGEPCRCLKTGSGGDLNGDGLDDVVVAAYLHKGKDEHNTGKVYAYYTNKGKLAEEASWTFEGIHRGGSVGYSITMGNFNGDAYADMVVGSAEWTYLFLGSAKGLKNQPDWQGKTGSRDVARAGDVNGDGVDDILVGLPQGRPDGPKKGKVILYYGSRAGTFSINAPVF